DRLQGASIASVGREYSDTCLRKLRNDGADGADPVEIGHLNIHKRDVWSRCMVQPVALQAVGGFTHHAYVLVTTYHCSNTLAYQGMVVHYQDCDGCVVTNHGFTLLSFFRCPFYQRLHRLESQAVTN